MCLKKREAHTSNNTNVFNTLNQDIEPFQQVVFSLPPLYFKAPLKPTSLDWQSPFLQKIKHNCPFCPNAEMLAVTLFPF